MFFVNSLYEDNFLNEREASSEVIELFLQAYDSLKDEENISYNAQAC